MQETPSARLISELQSSADIAGGLRRHYVEIILPMWRGRGFHSSLGLPTEALLADAEASPPAVARYRAMACARQLYVFTKAQDLPHATALFEALTEYFSDVSNGGFYYSVAADGTPLEKDKDLYTHAFVIFACAAYFGATHDARAQTVIDRTFDVIQNDFGRDAATGLPPAAMSPDFHTVRTGPRQNPLMHLTEAYLEARTALGDARFDDALNALLPPVCATFVDTETHCVMELPLGSADNWLEPGHQFEWFFLAQSTQHPAFAESGLDAHLRQAFLFGQRYGVLPQTGGVVAALDIQGRVRDPQQRIWAQTEYLRSLACHPDAEQQARLATQIERFSSRFLHDRGWHEILADDNQVVRSDMPSTTAYHLISSYLALP